MRVLWLSTRLFILHVTHGERAGSGPDMEEEQLLHPVPPTLVWKSRTGLLSSAVGAVKPA